MQQKNNKKVKQGRGIGEQNDRRHTVCHPILAINFTSGLQQCPHVGIKIAMSPIFIKTFMVTTKMLVSNY